MIGDTIDKSLIQGFGHFKLMKPSQSSLSLNAKYFRIVLDIVKGDSSCLPHHNFMNFGDLVMIKYEFSDEGRRWEQANGFHNLMIWKHEL